MAQLIHQPKPPRSRIDLLDDRIAKQWVKKLGKSKEKIAIAITKLGDNAETVMKELRTQLDDRSFGGLRRMTRVPPLSKSAAKTG